MGEPRASTGAHHDRRSVVKIGSFGTTEATRIHVAMGHFSQATYAREGASRT